MNQFELTFHHFGLALRSKEKASLFLQGLGYTIGEFMLDPLQNVYVNLCKGDNLPTIELVIPAASGGPLDKYLERQNTVFYHTCYLAPNAESSLDAIAKAGLGIVN